MPSQFDHWDRNLAGKLVPFHEGEPQPGYYRTRKPFRQGWGYPVCFFHDVPEDASDTEFYDLYPWVGYYGFDAQPFESDDEIIDIWTNVCQYPISFELYQSVMAGAPWPDSSIRRKREIDDGIKI